MCREDANPLPIATFPTPPDRDYCQMGNFGPHNLHENRPGSFQSEETIFATYHDAGVRVFDIKTSSAEGNRGLGSAAAHAHDRPAPERRKMRDDLRLLVTPDGLMYVSDWNAGLHVLQYEG